MTTPWFDPNVYAWMPGALLGVIGGGLGGPLIGTFAPQGKHKALVMGFLFTLLGVCALLAAAGSAAWAAGQPYGVWYGLGFPGVLGLIVFGALTPLVRKRYREAELRKMSAAGL
jgi:hypothetical protein